MTHIHIAGNVSFNGLIYPRSGGGDKNTKLCFEVLEGGATLITRLLSEPGFKKQHNCTVDGPNVEKACQGHPPDGSGVNHSNKSPNAGSSSEVSSHTTPGQSSEQGKHKKGATTPTQADKPGSGGTSYSSENLNSDSSSEVSPHTTPGQLSEQDGCEKGTTNSTQTDKPSSGGASHSSKSPNTGSSSGVSPHTAPGQASEQGERTIDDAAMRDGTESRRLSQADVFYCMSCSVPNASAGDGLMNAILDLQAQKSESAAVQHYKVEQLRKFDSNPTWYESISSGEAETIVMEGPTSTEPNIRKCTEWLARAQCKKLIFKMTRPLARGAIWDHIRRRTKELFVIVDANDLRAEGLDISRHLSWESTAQTFVKYAASTRWLHSLIYCPHLIVLFGCEGVIHCKEGQESTLYFDPKNAEGDFASRHSKGIVDVTGAFIAGLASSISDSSVASKTEIDGILPSAIRQGLTSARRLVEEGFISYKNSTPDYPVEQVTAKREQNHTISSIRIPKEDSKPNSWSIFLNLMGDTTEIARFIVRNGPGVVLSRVQTAQFGQLITADRQEMEGFRAITNLVEEYINGSKIEPLSIGVFGPPGCGKSFALTEVITGGPHPAKVEKKHFNISQFQQYSDLLSAFQEIRDVVLSGKIPMALFDEFDTSFGTTKLGWLRYFLAPMQDGRFLDQGQTHPLGRSIFVFMGGTSATFADFVKSTGSVDQPGEAPNPKTRKCSETQHFKSVKGPDFVSRLRGYVDIRGPDRLNNLDRMYSIRRAILLRALLERRMNMSSQHLHVDDTVLAGLLKVPEFNHGARSLEAILDMSRVSGRREFERAALPSEHQLCLHVKSEVFMDLVRTKDGLPDPLHENVSRKIKERLSSLRINNDYSNWGKEILASYDTHTAADDIVRKLRSINCYIVPKPSYPEESLPSSPEPQLKDDEKDRLAREDYERYLMEISNNQESRNTDRGTKPVSWEEEREDVKTIFHELIESILDIMKECDCCVYSLKFGAPIASKCVPI
ncbi:uncharacterized protein BO97DRAFT_465390 [Aspergillus homomorphus CBS 101889]|uniref:ATPase AAA-type core domain-containing protein n=1 Tax=Aspergillus homomorphus (strain CBS 101889) TaxID=1450537 RepID=A0A395I6C5_ASPHC|nr:hypothetical protein BO97DRAFT_465390 [Aspergillus homomorphus CBS 101889]RAL14738.1 hypothetical protein BO97DRAFT_465390 [Aspergillus homomorphus CBS 101889]